MPLQNTLGILARHRSEARELHRAGTSGRPDCRGPNGRLVEGCYPRLDVRQSINPRLERIFSGFRQVMNDVHCYIRFKAKSLQAQNGRPIQKQKRLAEVDRTEGCAPVTARIHELFLVGERGALKSQGGTICRHKPEGLLTRK